MGPEPASCSLVAELGDLNVVIVTDKAARIDLVRLTFGPGGYSENGLITSAQARELAEWLRIAASPGKTLAEAVQPTARRAFQLAWLTLTGRLIP
jgi:hypothetical protein